MVLARMRAFEGARDRRRLLDFRRACTTRENIDDYPTLSDLPELLDPALLGRQREVGLWEAEDGTLLAFSMTHLPYCNLYFFVRPDIEDDTLEQQIIAWGTERIRAFGHEQGRSVTLDTPCRDNDARREALLARSGFVRQGEPTLFMARSLSGSLPEVRLPEGYTLRPVAGEQEAEVCAALHRAAFGTENMTIETRLSIMHNPEYLPALDLLAVARDGRADAFCYSMLSPEMNAMSGRNQGEIAIIGTRPELRGQGLGRAMLRAGLHALKAQRLATAVLGTAGSNSSAQRLFLSEGFQIVYRTYWYSRQI